MGEHKMNPKAIAAKKGELPPKRKVMSKRQQEHLIKALIIEKSGLAPIFSLMGLELGDFYD